MTKANSVQVLFLEVENPPDLDLYATAMRNEFPGIQFALASTEAEAMEMAHDTTVLIAKAHNITATLVAAMPNLAWIQALTTGTDQLLKINLNPEIVVTSARGIHGPQMSELAFMFMLAFARDFRAFISNQSEAKWLRWPQRLLLGKTAVLVGVGAISVCLAERCKVFGMNVIGVSSTPRTVAGFDEIVGRDELGAAAARADFLIVLAPHTPQTHHMINASVLASMSPDAILINIARGDVCDQAALTEALELGRIAGAGLDVFSAEPLPKDDRLWRLPNVILTPHIGGMSDSYAHQTTPLVIENLRNFLSENVLALRNRVKLGEAS